MGKRVLTFTICTLILFVIMITSQIMVGNMTSLDQTNPSPYFNIDILAYSTSAVDQPLAATMKTELAKIGIGVNLTLLSTTGFILRTIGYTGDTSNGMPTFQNGGYDTFIIGNPISLNFNPEPYYHTNSYPAGYKNFPFFSNSTMDTLISKYLHPSNFVPNVNTGNQIQQIAYDQLPYISLAEPQLGILSSSNLPWTQNDLFMIENYLYNSYWSKLAGPTGVHNIVYDTPYFPDVFIPNVDTLKRSMHLNPVWSLMYEHNPSDSNFAYMPVMAKSLPVYTNSQKTIVQIQLRPGVTFSDGNPVTAEDVVNTYRMAMTPHFGFTNYNNYLQYFDTQNYGNNSVSVVNATTVQFRLGNPPLDLLNIFNEPILEEALTGNYTSPIVYGKNIDGYDYNAEPLHYAIGTGPFKYSTIDYTNEVVNVTQNVNWWGASQTGSWFGGSISLLNSIYFKTEANPTVALNDLQANSAQIADPWYQFTSSPTSGLSLTKINELANVAMEINMHHPILGTGVDTPLGKYDPNQAADAAKYVRQAIAYMVPQSIIDSVFSGFATQSTTLWPSFGVGYDSALTQRTYNLQKANDLMAKAGYSANFNPSSNNSPNSSNTNPKGFLDFSSSLLILSSLFVTLVIYRKRQNY